MFLKKKDGNIVAQFAVLLVFAVVIIFVVSAFGAKILSAFFPSGDKSALNSLETVNSVINAVMSSPYSYESETLGVYMAKKYEMVFFDKSPLTCKSTGVIATGTTGITSTYDYTSSYYSPSQCEGKQCICLYDNDPVDSEQKRDKNVVMCRVFEKDIEIHPDHFDLNDGVCGIDTKKYSSLIIAANQTSPTKRELIIMKFNEKNEALDKAWDVPVCFDEGNLGGICSRVPINAVVLADKDNFEKMYSFCSENKPYKTIAVKCSQDASATKCQPDCTYGDVTASCDTKYRQCSDFNKDSGIVRYMDQEQDYGNFQLCASDSRFCNRGCGINTWEPYICKTSQSGNIDSSCQLPAGCSAEYLEPSGKLHEFLKDYDSTKQECKDVVSQKYFENRGELLQCKGDLADCRNFILQRKDDCSIKYLSNSDTGYIYWITYFDAKCQSDVESLFDAAYYCAAANAQTNPAANP